jgi:hypothetical protein
MHLADKVVHPFNLPWSGMDDEVDALADHIELRVRYEDGNLDEGVINKVKPRHFAINPDEVGEFDSH